MSNNQYNNFLKSIRKHYNKTTNNVFYQLESRLIIALYRINLFPTIYFIKQIIKHGYITVNNNILRVEGYNLKLKDTFRVLTKSLKQKNE
jgi:ribosomal protein S4